MKRWLKISAAIIGGCAVLSGTLIAAWLYFTSSGVLTELAVSENVSVKFYWVDNWDLHHDLLYMVYMNGRRVYKSRCFFSANGKFNLLKFYMVNGRYVGIYDDEDPKTLMVVMDLQTQEYGHPYSTPQIPDTIVQAIRDGLGDDALKLYGDYYGFK